MGDEKHVPCSDTAIANAQVDNCRMPVLFHRATAIQVLEDDVDDNREVWFSYANSSFYCSPRYQY